jgi:hypothetical protein
MTVAMMAATLSFASAAGAAAMNPAETVELFPEGSYSYNPGPIESGNPETLDSVPAGTLEFGFTNNLDTPAALVTTIKQLVGLYGFLGGVDVSFGGTTVSVPKGAFQAFSLDATIDTGATEMLTFAHGASFGKGADLDVTVSAAPIPVPAAGLLLVGGLGALAAVRRRRRSA